MQNPTVKAAYQIWSL